MRKSYSSAELYRIIGFSRSGVNVCSGIAASVGVACSVSATISPVSAPSVVSPHPTMVSAISNTSKRQIVFFIYSSLPLLNSLLSELRVLFLLGKRFKSLPHRKDIFLSPIKTSLRENLQNLDKPKKSARISFPGGHGGCGGRIRTNDLRVMSPTSYQLLYPAICALFSKLVQSITRRRICQHKICVLQ